MTRRKLLCPALAGLTALTLGTSALAAPDPATPPQIQKLVNCRSIADSAARLACYDAAAGTISDAISRRDLIVVDREGVRSTRRSLFGLSLPRLSILNNGEEELTQVEGTLASVGRARDGYLFILREGGQWTQTDNKPFAIEPRAGDKVVIRRGVLGSYMLKVGRQPGVKVERSR